MASYSVNASAVARGSEWRHKEVELAAHDLLRRLDKLTS
jgi:hypothetical protein